MFVDVSAKARTNLDDLLESILLLAEVEELRANPDAEASGVVIESKLDPGRGAVVTVLVNRGTLQGRRRARRGRPLGPRARAARLQGPQGQGGDALRARRGARLRHRPRGGRVRARGRERPQGAPARRRARLPAQERGAGAPLAARPARSRRSSRTPAAASCRSSTSCSRPTCRARSRRSRTRSPSCRSPRCRCRSSSSGVGGITESDIMLAAASDAIVLGFNVRPVGEARQVADREGVEIRSYSVIYRAIDELRDAMQGMLAPEEVEETVGTVEVRAIFRASQGRHDRRLLRHRRQGHARREGAAGARRHDRLRRRDRVAAAQRRRRARGRGRLRVRHRAAQLRRRQGGRRDRGLRHAAGRAHALVVERQRARLAGETVRRPRSTSTSSSRTAVP